MHSHYLLPFLTHATAHLGFVYLTPSCLFQTMVWSTAVVSIQYLAAFDSAVMSFVGWGDCAWSLDISILCCLPLTLLIRQASVVGPVGPSMSLWLLLCYCSSLAWSCSACLPGVMPKITATSNEICCLLG